MVFKKTKSKSDYWQCTEIVYCTLNCTSQNIHQKTPFLKFSWGNMFPNPLAKCMVHISILLIVQKRQNKCFALNFNEHTQSIMIHHFLSQNWHSELRDYSCGLPCH